MDCDAQLFLRSALLRKIKAQAKVSRIPLSGSIELTHRCNLRCRHCYLGCQTSIHNHFAAQELSTKTWLKIIDDITAAGCLNLLLTGGEPLLRKDFSTIYQHAINNGLLVRVFSNGTIISNEVIEMFQQLPPFEIEITVYGVTAKTYESITCVPGTYARCMQGINKLIDNKLPLALKTIVLNLNQHEFFAIKNFAKNLGLRFRYDCSIKAQLDGNKDLITLRLKPEEIIAIDFADSADCSEWQAQDAKYGKSGEINKLYNCAAGICNFHIDPYGNLMPCMMSVQYKYNLLTGSFVDGWKNYFSQMLQKKIDPNSLCVKCDNRFLCSYCPAFNYLENGSERQSASFLCKLGHLRRERLNLLCKK